MAIGDSLWVGSDTDKVLSPLEARLAMAGLWATNSSNPVDVRTGVVWSGDTVLLTGTASTGPMTVNVDAFHFLSSKGLLNGPYQGCNPAQVAVAATFAPPALGLKRTDTLWVAQRDKNASILADAVTQGEFGWVEGVETAGTPAKPAVPVGTLEVGTVTYDCTSVVPTKTTDAQVTLATTCLWTAPRGGPIPVRNTTEKAALTAYSGMQVYRIDLGLVETYNGTAWAGHRVTFTPTVSGPTTLNWSTSAFGTKTGWYVDVGKQRRFHIEFIRGSDWNQGSGAYTFAVPGGPYASFRAVGAGWYQDTASPFAEEALTVKGNNVNTFVAIVAKTGLRLGSATLGGLWAENDEIVFDFTMDLA